MAMDALSSASSDLYTLVGADHLTLAGMNLRGLDIDTQLHLDSLLCMLVWAETGNPALTGAVDISAQFEGTLDRHGIVSLVTREYSMPLGRFLRMIRAEKGSFLLGIGEGCNDSPPVDLHGNPLRTPDNERALPPKWIFSHSPEIFSSPLGNWFGQVDRPSTQWVRLGVNISMSEGEFSTLMVAMSKSLRPNFLALAQELNQTLSVAQLEQAAFRPLYREASRLTPAGTESRKKPRLA